MSVAGCKAAKEWADRAKTGSGSDAGSAVEEAPPPPPPKPSGPGLPAGRYRVVEVAVEVMATADRGKPWDTARGSVPAPDLLLDVHVDGKRIAQCAASDNNVRARCRLDAPFELDERTVLGVDIADDDGDGDKDPIGAALLDDPSHWGIAMELPLVPQGRVRAAVVVLAHVPSFWQQHRAQIMAIVIGFASALLVTGLFRRSLLAPDPAPAAPPRCQHCGTRISRRASKCEHCGAPQ